MCELCNQRVAEMDPRLIKIMNEIEPEYRALALKVQEAFKVLTPFEVVDENDDPTELPDDLKEDLAKKHSYFARMVGMSAALGWFTAIDAENVEDVMQHVSPLMQTLQSTLNDGNAYRTVCMGVKH